MKFKMDNPYQQYGQIVNVNKQWSRWIGNMLSKMRRMKLIFWGLIYLVVIWTLLLITFVTIQQPMQRYDNALKQLIDYNKLSSKVELLVATNNRLLDQLNDLFHPLKTDGYGR